MDLTNFTYKATIRFFDIDTNNHVNNSVYFTYMEEARTKLLFDLYIKHKNEGVNFVVVEASCKYMKPIKLTDSIEIKLHIQSVNNTSFEIIFEFMDNENVRYARGYTKMACINANTEKIIRLPKDIADFCNKMKLPAEEA